MNKKPIISICIPTYNRVNKVFELVNNIIKYKGIDIEILVLDNCSTDDTKEFLAVIQDSRFRYIRNKKNIGGIKNIFKVLSLANGEYSFLCLDKDKLDYKKIEILIKRIKNDQDVLFGHCVLNSLEDTSDILFEKGFSSVYNMSYLAIHPTGEFYKTDIFRNLPILNQIFESNNKFGFYNELIKAEMSILGKSKMINLPIFYTETKEECENIKSFTYTNENEIFFSPSKRFEEFLTYGKNLYSLNLTNKEKNKIIQKLFIKTLISSTLGFKSIMKDNSTCIHYNIISRNISIIELIKIYLTIFINFIKCDLPINILHKFSLCIFASKKIFIKFLIN